MCRGEEDVCAPIGYRDAEQARVQPAIQAEDSLAFEDVKDGFVRGLFARVGATSQFRTERE